MVTIYLHKLTKLKSNKNSSRNWSLDWVWEGSAMRTQFFGKNSFPLQKKILQGFSNPFRDSYIPLNIRSDLGFPKVVNWLASPTDRTKIRKKLIIWKASQLKWVNLCLIGEFIEQPLLIFKLKLPCYYAMKLENRWRLFWIVRSR